MTCLKDVMFVQLEPMEDKGTIGDGGSGKGEGKELRRSTFLK